MDIKSCSQAQPLKAGGPGLAPCARFQNNGLPRLVWHPSKTTSKLPVVKHHINIVSCKILEITKAALPNSAAGPTCGAAEPGAGAWTACPARLGASSSSPPDSSTATWKRRQRHWGQEPLFTPAGRKCLQPESARPGSPLASVANRPRPSGWKPFPDSAPSAGLGWPWVWRRWRGWRGWQGLAGGGPHPFRVPRGFGRREVLSTLAHLNPFLLPLSPGMHFEGVTGTGVVAVGWIVPGK